MKYRNRLFIIFFVLLALIIGYRFWEGQHPAAPDPNTAAVVPEPAGEADSADPSAAATTFHLFYPYDTGTDFDLKEVTAIVSLDTQETPLERVSELLKESAADNPETLIPVLSPDAKILSVEMMKDNIIKVNVNDQFRTQMNAGSALEGQILKSLVKTLSSLYHADGVLLRVNGQPYESGHYYFSEEEIIYADHPGL